MKRPNKWIVFLDGDNTLWDTNAVFFRAQTTALTLLAEAGYDLGSDGLKKLREVDVLLARRMGVFEYEFVELAKYLIAGHQMGECSAEALVASTLQLTADQEECAGRAGEVLRTILTSSMPELLPGAQALLTWLVSQHSEEGRLFSVLISEGDAHRIDRIILHHELKARPHFDRIEVVPRKDVETLSRLVKIGGKTLGCENANLAIVGDSLNRDVQPGATIGATTIYKPAGFLGNEVPLGGIEPDYIVSDLNEALTILRALVESAPEEE